MCAVHSCFTFTKTESSLVPGHCFGMPELCFKAFPVFPSASPPHPISSPCLHPSTRLSCCHFPLRGQRLTLFTGSRAGVTYVRMQVCVLLFLSLNPFDHNPHQKKTCQHRHMRNGSRWAAKNHSESTTKMCVCVSMNSAKILIPVVSYSP